MHLDQRSMNGYFYFLVTSVTESKYIPLQSGYIMGYHGICAALGLLIKGCGMDPWLVLVSPCFRENVVATCKIGSFLCSLDNLLQKNIIVFFFGNQNSKWSSFEKRAILDLLFTIFSHQGKVTKIPSAHISLTNIHVFSSPYWLFCLTNFEKNTNLSGMVSLWYDSWWWFLFVPFWNNQLITKWWAKFKLECLLLICTYTNAKFIVICKPRTLNDGGEESRVRAFFHKTVRGCHVYCNFKIGFTCRIPVIFGTLKDGSLLINTVA